MKILTELYTRVKDIDAERKSTILCALYGLVECTSARVLLCVARVVLAVSLSLFLLYKHQTWTDLDKLNIYLKLTSSPT